MPITLSEAHGLLVNGTPLTWQSSGTYKAGNICLERPESRRLYKFLSEEDHDDVAMAADRLFDGITSAWLNEGFDPKSESVENRGQSLGGPWRLKKILASGFGGLNTSDGPVFELLVENENWCLEGYNGSGKTSLASVILWTLTGYKIREQDGPIKDLGLREPVIDDGKKIGTWPPLATYPKQRSQLLNTAQVSAELTFEDSFGNIATASRKIESPHMGEPILIEDIDPRLLVAPELIETGLLMPARIGHIGFGSKGQSLYDALKLLTGLDQLSSIGMGAAAFGHRAKRFLKYGKDNGIEVEKRSFDNAIERAKEASVSTPISLAEKYILGSSDLQEKLTSIYSDASTKAAIALKLVDAEISDKIDLAKEKDRTHLNDAVRKARVYVSDGLKGVPLFKAWGALKRAEDEGFSSIGSEIEKLREDLQTALRWHDRQQQDRKLRLKALAAKFYISVNEIDDCSLCPLCEAKLSSKEQQDLALELLSLKEDADQAERNIADACNEINKRLFKLIPDALTPHFDDLSKMDPASAFSSAIRDRFEKQPPFSDTLTGIGSFVANFATESCSALPVFVVPDDTLEAHHLPEVTEIRQISLSLKRVAALSAWWAKNRNAFADSWKKLIGEESTDQKWPADSLEGKLRSLEAAISDSEPLDRIATQINISKKHAEKWSQINQVQTVREDIAKSLEPLKNLQHLVDCETHRTVTTLQGRVQNILDEIRLKDRLSFESTAMSRKTVLVEGSFESGMKIDASLVANSSWLRGVLWAFIFALREQAIAKRGDNVFPLMVLDDPQATFDPKNKRKWAEKIVGMANLTNTDLECVQLFLATHERQFYDIVCETCELDGQQGLLAGPNSSTKVAHVVNGTFLDRQFTKASIDEDDHKGFEYIQQVRIYCEDLLRIMLRPESYEINGNSLGKLCELLGSLNRKDLAPYNRGAFKTLLKFLDERQQPAVKIMNAAHHSNEGTIGFAQAQDVQKYWTEKLKASFSNAFRVCTDFDAFNGSPRLFSWEDTVVEFPNGYKNEIGKLSLSLTGVAAAAETDGKIGDGQIQFENFDEVQEVKLYGHHAYRLNAGTLDPIAGIGDVVLVQEKSKPRSGNLVVVGHGDHLYARRLNSPVSHSDIALLTAHATDPYALLEPIIALNSGIKPKKIVGTVFFGPEFAPSRSNGNELCEIDDFSSLVKRVENAQIFQVKGRSMEPIALDGQHVLTVKKELDVSTLETLNGELIIAVDEDAGVYFKRLRLHGDVVVLESANSSATTASEILSVGENSRFKKLTDLWSVVGVLFDPLPQ